MKIAQNFTSNKITSNTRQGDFRGKTGDERIWPVETRRARFFPIPVGKPVPAGVEGDQLAAIPSTKEGTRPFPCAMFLVRWDPTKDTGVPVTMQRHRKADNNRGVICACDFS